MKKILSLVAAAAMAFSANAALSSTDFSSNNYIQEWGRLKLVGNQLSSEKGEAIQLKGWSSFGNFTENCLTSTADLTAMKAWGANIVRLVQYPKEGQKFTMTQIKSYIDGTKNEGMYCLVDWHVLKTSGGSACSYCGNPKNIKSDAESFFREVAQYVQQKGYNHVLYELCNEPDEGIWGDIKNYAQDMINLIAEYDRGAVVIVGTPRWSQQIYSVAHGDMIKSPYTDKAQVMYSFHFYANGMPNDENAHVKIMDNEFVNACKSMPVFVTEWGMCSAQPEAIPNPGFHDYNKGNSDKFWNAMGGMYGQKVSWCNWAYGNKPEGASAFNGGCKQANLTAVGKYVIEYLGGQPDVDIPVGECYGNCYEFSTALTDGNDSYFGVEGFNNGGEGVGYHDANDSDEETETQPSEKGDGCQAAVAAGYSTFRADECVDASGASGEKGTFGTGYSIGWISTGEWLRYTVNVTDPGYYKVEFGTNDADKLGGPVVFEDVKGLEIINSDIDASTNTENAMIDQIYPDINLSDKLDVGWATFGFVQPCAEEEDPGNYGICLKEGGERTIQISFPDGMSGTLGSLRFTYVKPYTGEGYKGNNVGVQDAAKVSNVTIYPTVATEQIFVNTPVSKIEIINLIGEVLISSEEKQSVNISELAKGSYIAKAYTKNFGIVSKQFIKK